MSTGRTLRLAFKELREILRDRRTVLTLVLMPLLVYPLLGVIMRKGVLSNLSLNGETTVVICFSEPAESAAFEYQMASGRTILEAENSTRENQTASPLLPTMQRTVKFNSVLLNDDVSLETAVRSGEVDLGIRIEPVLPEDVDHDDPREVSHPFFKWEIFRREGSALGNAGFEEIQKNLDAVNSNYTMLLLQKNNLPTLPPQQLTERQLKTEENAPPTLITFIPLVLVLMTMTGAVYPAIDLTAGERERGTMEILVAAPVSRTYVLAGKFGRGAGGSAADGHDESRLHVCNTVCFGTGRNGAWEVSALWLSCR